MLRFRTHNQTKWIVPVVLPLLSAGIAVGGATQAHAQASAVYAYLSDPNEQFAPTSITNTKVETFSSLSAGNQTGTYTSSSSTGLGATYSGTFDVAADDSFGAGTGNYFAIGSQSGTTTPVTLTFASPVSYFGLSYQAGDVNNGMTFYDAAGKVIGRYSTTTLINTLQASSSVTAIDGTVYSSAAYYGKPSGGGVSNLSAKPSLDTNEPFSFLNFFAKSGTTISKVVFDNSGTTGTGFESDNHTISTSAVAPPTTGKFVFIGAASAPDGSTLALVLSSLPVLGCVAARRRK